MLEWKLVQLHDWKWVKKHKGFYFKIKYWSMVENKAIDTLSRCSPRAVILQATKRNKVNCSLFCHKNNNTIKIENYV